MGRKRIEEADFPSLVCDRLKEWGLCIRKQRVAQGILAVDLCRRLGISHPTLRRLELGEPSIGAAYYLSALHILGVLDAIAAQPNPALWLMANDSARARAPKDDDNDYF
ncbi:MAG: helix-turn-helix transcriptional regulator [Pseudomonadota bacterium]